MNIVSESVFQRKCSEFLEISPLYNRRQSSGFDIEHLFKLYSKMTKK